MPITSLTSYFNTSSFGNTNTYTRNQEELSLTLEAAAHELSDWKSLLTMSAGGGFFEGGKLAARVLLGATPTLCAVPFLADVFTFAAGAIADTGLTGVLQQAFGNAGDENETFVDRLTSQGGVRLMGLLGMGQGFMVMQLLQGLASVSRGMLCENSSRGDSRIAPTFPHHLILGLQCHFGSGMFAGLTGGIVNSVEQRISLKTRNVGANLACPPVVWRVFAQNKGRSQGSPLQNLKETISDGLEILSARWNPHTSVAGSPGPRPPSKPMHMQSHGGSASSIHPSIRGGEYDPEKTDPTKVEQLRRRLLKIYTPKAISEIVRVRRKQSLDDLLAEMKWIDTPAGVIRKSSEEARIFLGQTEFARGPQKWKYLRDVVLPSFADPGKIVIGDFCPGCAILPGVVEGKTGFTYEPFLLRDIFPEAKPILVYDFLPETHEAIQYFDGEVLMKVNYPLIEAVKKGDISLDVPKSAYGPQWEKSLTAQKQIYEAFLARHGGVVLEQLMIQIGSAVCLADHVRINASRLKDIRTPLGVVDLVLADLSHQERMDLILFEPKNPYLELGNNSNTPWGHLTLMAITERLNTRAYLFTDPPTDRKGVGFTHVPSPSLMHLLGLEAVVDMRDPAFLEIPTLVFQKVRPMDPVIEEILRRRQIALRG